MAKSLPDTTEKKVLLALIIMSSLNRFLLQMQPTPVSFY
jgi:hypothetical protein